MLAKRPPCRYCSTPLEVGELPKLRKVLDRRVEELRIKMENGRCHGVLVLLDLDDATACPVTEACALAADLAGHQLPYPAAVVFARREYEEWLVASLPTIAPATPLLSNDLRRDYPPESIRNPKGWLKSHTRNRYRETIHQAEFTRHLDPALVAAECRSFRRLETAVAQLLTRADGPLTERQGVVTPRG